MKKFIAFVFVAACFGAAIYFAKGGMTSSHEMASRMPDAVGVAGQQQVIDQMNQIILSIKDKSQVKAAAQKIAEMAKQENAKAFPGVQMYGAVASLVPDLEGIVFRCRAFVETSDWLHMSWLFGLRDFSYNDYLYGPHVKAAFDFITYPSEKAGPSFAKFSDFQDFALATLAPKLEKIVAASAELEKLPSANFEFMFDRTILVGQGPGLRFLDPEEAKKLFTKPYHYTVTFVLQRALATIYYVGAMDLDELPVVFNRVIRATTINTVRGDLRIGDPAKGVTPKMVYDVFASTKSFLGWRNKITVNGKEVTAQSLLDRSFYYGLTSSYYQLAGYVCGLKYPYARTRGTILEIERTKDCMAFDQEGAGSNYMIANGSPYLFNPNAMVLDFKQKYHALRDRVRAYSAAQKGDYVSIVSDVTGQSIRVNVKAFFKADVSQRDFMPTGYANAPASSGVEGMPNVKAWNYDHGKPNAFKDYSFGGFFDRSQVNSSESLYKAMSTVLYTDAIAPFALWVRVPSTARFFIPPSEIINAN
ncbi:hypothetical protein [Bdellovibrio sp. HCB337]|uniref:hypothetical protein n=1 Tax=Bdellovibrio sp. HCB337 TaxID=3394358 RepID=UPI0039A7100E